MADIKLNELGTATDLAQAYVEDASGAQKRISKSDLSTAVGGVKTLKSNVITNNVNYVYGESSSGSQGKVSANDLCTILKNQDAITVDSENLCRGIYNSEQALGLNISCGAVFLILSQCSGLPTTAVLVTTDWSGTINYSAKLITPYNPNSIYIQRTSGTHMNITCAFAGGSTRIIPIWGTITSERFVQTSTEGYVEVTE